MLVVKKSFLLLKEKRYASSRRPSLSKRGVHKYATNIDISLHLMTKTTPISYVPKISKIFDKSPSIVNTPSLINEPHIK